MKEQKTEIATLQKTMAKDKQLCFHWGVHWGRPLSHLSESHLSKHTKGGEGGIWESLTGRGKQGYKKGRAIGIDPRT